MRSLLIALPILIAAAVLQSAVFSRLRFVNGGFELVLVVVLAWNLAQRKNDGPLWAFIGGLIADLMSGAPYGAGTLALTAVSLVVVFTEGRFYQSNWFIAVLLAVVGTILYHLLYLSVLAAFGYAVNWADTLTVTTLPSTLLNVILMLPTYQVMKWLAEQLAPPSIDI